MLPDTKKTATTNSETSLGFANSLKNLGSALSDVASSAIKSGSEILDQSETGRKAKEYGSKAADLASKVVDEAAITGKKISANLSGEEAQLRIEALVDQQRRYNDILATRLAEALDRIEALERQVKELSCER